MNFLAQDCMTNEISLFTNLNMRYYMKLTSMLDDFRVKLFTILEPEFGCWKGE